MNKFKTFQVKLALLCWRLACMGNIFQSLGREFNKFYLVFAKKKLGEIYWIFRPGQECIFAFFSEKAQFQLYYSGAQTKIDGGNQQNIAI